MKRRPTTTMEQAPIAPDMHLPPADALLVVPPFYDITTPSIAVHLLQACARAAGFRVAVLYANLRFARLIGVDTYAGIGFPRHYPPEALLGERLFARAAHADHGGWDGNSPATSLEAAFGPTWARWMTVSRGRTEAHEAFSASALAQIEEQAVSWIDDIAEAIAKRRYRVVGCSTMFAQTNAAIALLRTIKRLDPGVATIVGGANCEGEMAQGVASLDPKGDAVDTIFSGESEDSFVQYMRDLAEARRPPQRILNGASCTDLDALPTPDFGEYFAQLASVLPELSDDPDSLTLPYESSRGCSWGERQQCTFCGINGPSLAYREKSPARVASDLVRFAADYPARRVDMADSIMPARYFHTLLPKLAQVQPGLSIGYGVRADLSLGEVLALKRAGVGTIQPGIEALSTSLLRRMRKGMHARQNIALLRYARAGGLRLLWALLWGFPGDRQEDYEQTLALLPLLHHLPPPGSFLHLSIDRFSPYFEHPDPFGLRSIAPLGSYRAVFPPSADIGKLAYHFTAEYEAGSHRCPALIEALAEGVRSWQARWRLQSDPAVVQIVPAGRSKYLLLDTRGLNGIQAMQVLGQARAAAALVPRRDVDAPEIAWALEQKVGVLLDGWYVPLATAEPELLLAFEGEGGTPSSEHNSTDAR